MLILSYFWFDFVDFVFGSSNVEIGFGGRLVIVGWCWVDMVVVVISSGFDLVNFGFNFIWILLGSLIAV